MDGEIKFDHSRPCSTLIKNDRSYIEQDGILFTNATFNPITERWEPEPRVITSRQEIAEIRKNAELILKSLAEKYEKHIDTLMKALSALSLESEQRYNKMWEANKRMTGEMVQLKTKLKNYQDDSHISELKEKIKELEEKKAQKVITRGRPKK